MADVVMNISPALELVGQDVPPSTVIASSLNLHSKEKDALQLADRMCPMDVASKHSEKREVTFSSSSSSSSSNSSSSTSITVTPYSSQTMHGSDCHPTSSTTRAETETETETGVVAKVVAPLLPLPSIPSSSLRREFIVTPGLDGVDVTSLDITPHGCYVLAGCGNGMVLLFDLTQPTPLPALVGQIVAKGLHTNLLLTVKISEDCRYGFAGVNKGSSELLAIDLGRLPGWPNQNTASTARRRDDFVSQLVHCYRNSDPKLRGFGDAVRLRTTGSAADADSGDAVYRLACGRGIKNVHVWQFVSPPPGAPRETMPTWTCIYDVASNGNTIESVVFRNGGHELLSKSAGVCLRVWDLRSHETDPLARPTFEDIQNSTDVRSLHDGFAFGGTYEFAVVRIAAPKAANRDVLEVPGRALSLKAAGRRMIRQVEDVIATADARHALVLCTDGGIIYYNRAMDNEPSLDNLVELSSIQRDPDAVIQIGGRGWALRRAGEEGEVLLLRTLQTNPVTIVVSPLSDTSTEIKSTSVADQAGAWTEWGYFLDPTIPPQPVDDHMLLPADLPKPLPLVTPAQKAPSSKASSSAAAASTSGRPPLVPGTSGGSEKSVKRQRKTAPTTHQKAAATASGQDSAFKLAAPTPNQALPPRPKAQVQIDDDAAHWDNKHHHHQHNSQHNYHQQQHQQQLQQQQQQQQQQQYSRYLQLRRQEEEDAAYYSEIPEPPQAKRRALVLAQPPAVRRVVEVPLKLFGPTSATPLPSLKSVIFERFKSLCSSWIEGGKRSQGRTDAVLADRAKGWQPLGVNTLRHLGSVCVEQDRLKSQFIGEVARCMGRHLQAVTDVLSEENLELKAAAADLDAIILRYQRAASDMVTKSQVDMSGFVAMDALSGAAVGRCELEVVFRHGDLWEAARGFLRTCDLLVSAAFRQHRGQLQ